MTKQRGYWKNYDYKLPVISNQKANAKINRIGKLAGIDELVNGQPKYEHIVTHTARRSAATHMLKAGLNRDIIKKIGGWKSNEVLELYFRINEYEAAQLAAEKTDLFD